jgi:hypothetical protein
MRVQHADAQSQRTTDRMIRVPRRPPGQNRWEQGPTTTEERRRFKTSAPIILAWHSRAFASAFFTAFTKGSYEKLPEEQRE